jgi:DNA-binding NarL/FixJ family response regulator
VLIVGEPRLSGEALALALRAQPQVALAQYRATLAEAQATCQQLALDCVLLNGDGPLDQLVPQLRALRAAASCPPVLVLAAAATPSVVAACLRAGAVGCLGRDTPFRELIGSLQAAVRGGRLFSAEQLVQVALERPASVPLTPREQQVLQVIAHGRPADEAATELGISPATLHTHLKHAMTKLGARSRVEAVVLALQAGLIRLSAAAAADVQGYCLNVG